MRRVIASFLLFLFLVPIVNQGMKVHFCGEKITGLSFYFESDSEEDCDCKEIGDMDCCSDRVIQSDQTGEKLLVNSLELPMRKSLATVWILPVRTTTFFKQNKTFFPIDIFGSPPEESCDLSLLQVFRC